MTIEERYAEQWRKDAWAEGHRKKLPSMEYMGGAVRNPSAYDEIIKAVINGAT